MYARIARFEGGEADAIRRTAAEIKSTAAAGPPEGLKANGFLLLIDPDNGRGLGVTLFETEADMRAGDEVLNAMSPPSDGMGRRTSVEMYEVAVEMRT